jgi:uncharacterized protein YeaO (DUF488 family)
MSAESRIRVGRIYEDIDPDEGQRVLVDRIWPRGIRKDELRKLTRRGVVTLVTATRDLDGSQAAVLAKLLEGS